MGRGSRLLKSGALVIGGGPLGAPPGSPDPVDSPQLVAPDLTGRRRIETFENPQTVIAANPGGRFSLMPGVHSGRTLNLASSSYNNTDILGEPGAILDGGSANIRCIWGGANGVTFRGWNNPNRLIIRNYKLTAAQTTAVMGGASDDSSSQASGWTFGYLDIQDSGQVAFRLGRSCYAGFMNIQRATQLGVGGGGFNTSGSPTIMEYCSIVDSNTGNSDPGFEGGASKFAVANWLIVRHCSVTGNSIHGSAHDGYGLWTDVDVENYSFHDNTVSHVPRCGIVIEISGAGSVYNNTISDCGFRWSTAFLNTWGFSFGAGIQICASGVGPNGSGLDVYGNTLTNCYEGIDILEQPRGRWQRDNAYEHYSYDVDINDNDLTNCGPSGMLFDHPLGTWNSSTTYVAGTDPEANTSAHVVYNGRIYRAQVTNTNVAPSGTSATTATWRHQAVVPWDAARLLRWSNNRYTNCGSTGSILQATSAPFYWSNPSHPSLATWRAIPQDTVASGSTFA